MDIKTFIDLLTAPEQQLQIKQLTVEAEMEKYFRQFHYVNNTTPDSIKLQERKPFNKDEDSLSFGLKGLLCNFPKPMLLIEPEYIPAHTLTESKSYSGDTIITFKESIHIHIQSLFEMEIFKIDTYCETSPVNMKNLIYRTDTNQTRLFKYSRITKKQFQHQTGPNTIYHVKTKGSFTVTTKTFIPKKLKELS